MANVLVLGKYYYPFKGGIEDNTKYVCERLAESHNVTVLAFSHDGPGGTDVISGVTVKRFTPLAVLKSQPISFRIGKEILSHRADVIHFHAPNVWSSLFLVMRLGLSRNAPPCIITHHMDIYKRPMLRFVARQLYDRLIAQSRMIIVTSLKNARISQDLRAPAHLHEVPLGLDMKQYVVDAAVEERAAQLRARYGGMPLIGFVGRHARYKGLDILVKAVSLIPGAAAVIAGDGPHRARAEEMARQLGVIDRVHFVGLVDHQEKLALLRAIDVFAFPSTEITEAFGVSQLEAMAIGAPVVATDLPTGVTDVAVDGETALTVPTSNAQALANAIQRLAGDKELATTLSAEARRRVHAKFNNEAVSTETARLIESVLPHQLKEI